MPSKEELGKRIKGIRLQKGLTLKEVEILSGVSMTHTSQIERGMTSPTVGALEKLARALDRTASYFMEESALEEVSRLAKEERGVFVNEETGIRLEGLSSGILGANLHFYQLYASPVTREPQHRSHSGEEAITVSKGCLEVKVGDVQYTLKSGDSIHYKSAKPHSIYTNHKSGAEAIWVGTAPPIL